MGELVESIRARYQAVLQTIEQAAKRAGRDSKTVRLVVVTKSQSLDVTRATMEAGATVLGENYPEEGVLKIQALHEFSAVEWHMIGHVQSRKARQVAMNFHFLHSLDSLKLAKLLDKFCDEAGRKLSVLLEVNLGGEQSKSGWPAGDENISDKLAGEVAEILTLQKLRVRGLMTMPPLGATAEDSRPYFQKLVRLRETLSNKFPQADFRELSMGTSSDYEVAVEEGATFVRIGTAIVGARNHKLEAE